MGDEYRDSARQWRVYSLVLLIFLTAVIVGFAVLIVYYEIIRVPEGAGRCRRIKLKEQLLQGDPGRALFQDLTESELSALEKYLYSNKAFNLKTTKKFAPNSSYLYNVELLLPNKSSVLLYLDSVNVSRPESPREARVVLFRGDLTPAVVEEYAVGPLNSLEYHRLLKSVPYIYRPVSTIETRAVRKLLRRVDVTLKYVLEESFEASFFDCDPQCLIMDYYTPVSSAVSGKNVRLMWYWTHYKVQQPMLNPVDFFILFNFDGPDPTRYHVERLWYSGQEYNSPEDILEAYISGNLVKSSIPFPVDPHNSVSNDEAISTLRRSPKVVEPDGQRYSVNQGRIQYMEWDFHFRMSTSIGPQLLDIRHRNKRILYELSLQEIAAFSSGYHPWLRYSNMVYSSLFGRYVRPLIPAVDCPQHATFIPIKMSREGVVSTVTIPSAFCVFEQDSGSPLRVHTSNNFYSGLSDISLTLRSIISILGNEFIIDFVFRLNGVLQIRATIAGFPMGTFYARQESRYGFRLRENFIAPVRQFSFHFKVDLDIHGTRNRFQTLDIQTQDVNTGDWSVNGDTVFQQLKIRTDLKMTEQEGAIKNISGKYFLFHNDKIKTKYNDPRAYRLQLIGDAPGQLLSPGTGNEAAVSWARYCLAVTKCKHTETSSSSIYSMWDSQEPVVNFQNSIDDNENIIDEVSKHLLLVFPFDISNST